MTQVTTKTKEKVLSLQQLAMSSRAICSCCGGNGYTKSTPTCYRTCLVCLGKGHVSIRSINVIEN